MMVLIVVKLIGPRHTTLIDVIAVDALFLFFCSAVVAVSLLFNLIWCFCV